MDVIVVRKLGLPRHPEVAMGALGEGGVVYIDWAVVLAGGVSAAQLEHVIEVQSAELDSRVRILRGQRPPPELQGRAVVIVDDGIATGATVQAAVRVARGLGAARVVVAAPVAPRHVVELLERVADQVVVLETPEAFRAVGEFYIDFTPTDDLQVKAILRALSAGGGVVSPAPVDVGEPGPARVVLT
jgi:putative phosphoribosyl transferase